MNMRKGIKVVLFLCLLPSLAFASSPFGITLGMTVEEMESAWMHPERIYEGEGFYWVDPPYPVPFFTMYAVKVDQEHGVYIVQAYSDEILCDSSGSQIKEAYLQLEEEMNAQFGRGERSWDIPMDSGQFLETLLDGAWYFYTEYYEDYGNYIADDIFDASLMLIATSPTSGVIQLEYLSDDYWEAEFP